MVFSAATGTPTNYYSVYLKKSLHNQFSKRCFVHAVLIVTNSCSSCKNLETVSKTHISTIKCQFDVCSFCRNHFSMCLSWLMGMCVGFKNPSFPSCIAEEGTGVCTSMSGSVHADASHPHSTPPTPYYFHREVLGYELCLSTCRLNKCSETLVPRPLVGRGYIELVRKST